MDPFTAVALFGAVTNIAFGISAGNKAKRAREEQARVEAENAARAADRILSEDLPQMAGAQRVAVAKAGFKMEGTPFQVMMDSARRMARDAGDIRSRGIENAQYLRQQGRVERQSAIMSGVQGAIGSVGQAVGNQTAADRLRDGGTPNVDRGFFMPSNSLGARG